MAWQKIIVGWEIKEFEQGEIIPTDAVFLTTSTRQTGIRGWISNLQPVYSIVYHYQVPVYEKRNIKKIK